MENASKALIMAGTVLITIVLIALAVFMLRSTSQVVDKVDTQINANEINLFNMQFQKYEGNAVNSANVKALIQIVKSNNDKYEFNDNTVPGTDKYIIITGINDLTQLNSSKAYKVNVSLYNKHGYISTISIEEI